MKLRMKLAALTTVAISAAGWAWASSAVALDGRGPSQPIAAGTPTDFPFQLVVHC